jgi:hypothetical protein
VAEPRLVGLAVAVGPDERPRLVEVGRVAMVASGNSRVRIAPSASASMSGSPCLLTATGSRTTGTPAGRVASRSATSSHVPAVPSMPILTASTPMSSTTLRNWAATASAGRLQTPWTPTEFCAVTAVMTLMPCTPWASMVLRSAWIPAPPPESEPAMVSTRAVGKLVIGARPAGSGRSR